MDKRLRLAQETVGRGVEDCAESVGADVRRRLWGSGDGLGLSLPGCFRWLDPVERVREPFESPNKVRSMDRACPVAHVRTRRARANLLS